jgi:hypothetical protein
VTESYVRIPMMVIWIPDPMSLSQFIPMPQIACPNRPELAECRLYLSMDYERAKAQSPVLKTVRPERVSAVRIPPPPPSNPVLHGFERSASWPTRV